MIFSEIYNLLDFLQEPFIILSVEKKMVQIPKTEFHVPNQNIHLEYTCYIISYEHKNMFIIIRFEYNMNIY